MGSRERERSGGELTGDLLRRRERGEIVGVDVDQELVRHEPRTALGPPLRLHRPLDTAQDLDRLELGSEQPRAGAFHEPLEEALHARHGSHGR